VKPQDPSTDPLTNRAGNRSSTSVTGSVVRVGQVVARQPE
jgi:hypothetical protein